MVSSPQNSNYEQLLEIFSGQISPEFDEWVRRFSLQGFAEKSLYTVLVWIKHCAPKDVPQESVTLACMELQCLFILDDYGGDDYREFYGRYSELLERYEVQPVLSPSLASETGFLAAADWFLARMLARGHSLRRYIAGKKDHLKGITWRNSVNKDQASVSFAQYLDARMTTIYVRQWMNLWEVIDGCMLSGDEIETIELRQATELHCAWQVYINERVSVARDESLKALNLVNLLQKELSMSRIDAVRRIRELEDQALAECREKLNTLEKAALSPWMKRYLEFFRICVDGTILNYKENVSRYSDS